MPPSSAQYTVSVATDTVASIRVPPAQASPSESRAEASRDRNASLIEELPRGHLPTPCKGDHTRGEIFTYRLRLRIRTPAPTMRMPSHSRPDGRSPRKTKANIATRTRLSLSTGATFDASPT